MNENSVPSNWFELQQISKNPLRFQRDYAEIACFWKSRLFWVKFDYEDMGTVIDKKWKIDKKTDNYYMVTSHHDKKNYTLAREIVNPRRGQYTDHINGDPIDNRRINLRECNPKQNMQNRRSLGGKSKFKGIYFCKLREQWVAQISCDGKTKNIGRFLSEKQAALAYDEQAKIHHGEFARLNFDKDTLQL